MFTPKHALKLRTQGLPPTMPTHTKPNSAEFISSIHDTLASIFQGAQSSNASHKRRINNLCKLHNEAVTLVQHKEKGKAQHGSIVLVGEKAFNRAFWEIVMCTLDVKRGVVEADRIVRFIGGFVSELLNDPSESTSVAICVAHAGQDG
jgi:condensin complex subunit 3